MKKLIINFLIFLFPLSVIFLFVDYKVGNIPNDYLEKRQLLESRLDDIELLKSTGSSHGYAINPQFLTLKGLNLSNNAEDLFYNISIVEKYLDRMPNLKIIVLSISYSSFEYRFDHSQYAWREPFYYLFWGVRPQNIFSLFNIKNFSFITAYGINDVISFIENGYRRKGSAQPVDSNGWRGFGTDEITESYNTERVGKMVVDANNAVMQAEFVQRNRDILDKFIEVCRMHHIKLIMVTTPVHHSFYDQMDPIKYARMQDNISFLINKYHVTYLNYFKNQLFNSRDFIDPDHLNIEGVEKFSKLLGVNISNLLETNNS